MKEANSYSDERGGRLDREGSSENRQEAKTKCKPPPSLTPSAKLSPMCQAIGIQR